MSIPNVLGRRNTLMDSRNRTIELLRNYYGSDWLKLSHWGVELIESDIEIAEIIHLLNNRLSKLNSKTSQRSTACHDDQSSHLSSNNQLSSKHDRAHPHTVWQKSMAFLRGVFGSG